jgi:hypothetical protein
MKTGTAKGGLLFAGAVFWARTRDTAFETLQATSINVTDSDLLRRVLEQRRLTRCCDNVQIVISDIEIGAEGGVDSISR